jgi:hypothetical protein
MDLRPYIAPATIATTVTVALFAWNDHFNSVGAQFCDYPAVAIASGGQCASYQTDNTLIHLTVYAVLIICVIWTAMLVRSAMLLQTPDSGHTEGPKYFHQGQWVYNPNLRTWSKCPAAGVYQYNSQTGEWENA